MWVFFLLYSIESTDLQDIADEVTKRDTQDALIQNMFDPMLKQYECTCHKKYKTLGHFKQLLEKEHDCSFLLTYVRNPITKTKLQFGVHRS